MVKQYIFLIVISSMWIISAMESDSLQRKIYLEIDPSVHYSLHCQGRPKVNKNFLAFLKGLTSKDHGVQLIPNDQPYFETKRLSIEGTTYLPEDLQNSLTEETVNTYPLHWHKKINTLRGNEKLYFTKRLTDSRLQKIKMPKNQRQRMLTYLLNDETDREKDCFDLCNEIIFDHLQPGEYVSSYTSLMHYLEFVSRGSCFKAGDAVALCYMKNKIAKIKQYAIALGGNLYMTKLHIGGMLYISDLKSLMRFWQCNSFVKVDPSIGKRDDFINDPFRSIAYHPISMNILLKRKELDEIWCTQPEFFTTKMTGFRCENNQVMLRSDVIVKGTCRGITCSTTDDFNMLLKKGLTNSFFLSACKQLHYLAGDEILFIRLLDSEDEIIKEIEMPNRMKKKLLRYLTYDSTDLARHCLDFCRKLCLKNYHSKDLLDTSFSYDHKWRYAIESDLKPGDAIALGCGNSIKHFAVALGDRLYLSKFGNGGSIEVTNMKCMLDYYKCTNFVVIEPDITKYKKFLYEALGSLTTSIRF